MPARKYLKKGYRLQIERERERERKRKKQREEEKTYAHHTTIELKKKIIIFCAPLTHQFVLCSLI